jgi:hypothetical protein
MCKCQRHYGVSPFSSFKHSEDDSYVDPFDGERKASEQMVWLLKKGDMTLSNKPRYASIDFCRRFGRNDSKAFPDKCHHFR